MAMLDKKTANEAYTNGKCIALFAHGDDIAKQGFLPGEWLQKHLAAANNIEKVFLVFSKENVGLYEISE